MHHLMLGYLPASSLCSQAYQVCTASTSVETSVGITTSCTCIPAEVELLLNTHGGLGHNIQCSRHNEHTNKLFKEIIPSIGANLKEGALSRAARSIKSFKCIRER